MAVFRSMLVKTASFGFYKSFFFFFF
ncbi:hypothetical protein CCACVL1_29497 [Corchorus capsularis]|uniref:Uncharacterized protein n=1 Tax=Corchorus capsularis TaxID=210143 RepID=A0A1R3G1F3_COCAP|nr:hypothetical protein CCACVL1_29497 [Corchorus capsularis]